MAKVMVFRLSFRELYPRCVKDDETKCYFCIYFFLSTFFIFISVVVPFVSLITIITQIFKFQKLELINNKKSLFVIFKMSKNYMLHFEHVHI